MKAILEKLLEVEQMLEDLEHTSDRTAWLAREAYTLLVRARGILEAIVADEQ